MTHEQLLDSIYEAGAFPDRWPSVLQNIAHHVGALGGNLIHSGAGGVITISSPAIEDLTQRFGREGWEKNNPRVGRLLQRADHPGFLTDRDIVSAEEMEVLPVYRDFLTPLGADAGAATLIQGNAHDAMVLSMEAFSGHDAAAQAVTTLDMLRPHLARSVTVGSRIRSAQNDNLLRTFALTGLSVALLGRGGRIISATDGFAAHFDGLLRDGPKRLRVADDEGDARLAEGLQHLEQGGTGLSIAVRDPAKVGRAILHLVPARLDARDLFAEILSFAILAHPDNRTIPGADLISALFDLTPAEARVARGIASGRSPSELARQWKLSEETVRSQLKKVFTKTSTRRQSELGLLLSGFSSSAGEPS
ncbi:MAG: LuxR C-terminal-related transcriptional regulator [Sphingobium sp.]